MTTLAEIVDRYLPDLVNKHENQLLPGHYQALHALVSRAQVTSASLLTRALSFSPRAKPTFKIVPKLGLRSPNNDLLRLSLERPESLTTWVMPWARAKSPRPWR